MTKNEEVYRFIRARQVVTADELADWARPKGMSFAYLYKAHLHRLLEKGWLVKPRKGIYCAIDTFAKDRTPVDRYLLAASLVPRYYLGHHTALELLGASHSEYERVFVSTFGSMRFREFGFQDVTYTPVASNDLDDDVLRVRRSGRGLNISSPSRTFVECIDRPDLCGGWEEALKSLEGLRGVDLSSIRMVLKGRPAILGRRVGLVLDIMRERSPFYGHITEKALEALQPDDDAVPGRLAVGKENRLDRKWRLYVPKGFLKALRGV